MVVFFNGTRHGFRSSLLVLGNDSSVDMIYLDCSRYSTRFIKAFLHKLRDLCITGQPGVWVFPLLTNRTHFV